MKFMDPLKIKLNWFLVFVILLGILPLVIPIYYTILTTDALLLGLLAMSVGFLIGFTGMLSFGHAAFYGITAYIMAVSFKWYGISLWYSMLYAILGAGLLGFAIGYISIRRRGIYFAILTLASAEVVFRTISYTRALGGADGIHGLPRLLDPFYYYYLVLAALLVSYMLLRKIADSPFGKVLQAIRENEERVRFIGYDVEKYKLIAFVISSLIAGLAGALYTGLHTYASPALLTWTLSGEAIVATFVGGMQTLMGPVIGSIFLILLLDILSTYWMGYLVIISLTLILITIFMPYGILGFISKRLKLL